MLVSVIMPAYNTERTLNRAVQSVLDQSFQDFELILVDDGSQDNTPEMCDQWVRKSSQITALHIENSGPSVARNRGIQEAKGDFIAFLDSDDTYEPGILERFKETLDAEQMDLYIFNYEQVDEDSRQVAQAVDAIYTEAEEAVRAIYSYNGLDFYVWNKIFDRRLFESIRFPEGKIYEDIYVSYQAVSHAKKVVTSCQVGVFYYASSESLVGEKFQPRQMDSVYERERQLEVMRQDFPRLVGLTAKKLMDGLLGTAYKLTCSPRTDYQATYRPQLLALAKKHREDFKESSAIRPPYRWAWWLYKCCPKVYVSLYEWYLGGRKV